MRPSTTRPSARRWSPISADSLVRSARWKARSGTANWWRPSLLVSGTGKVVTRQVEAGEAARSSLPEALRWDAKRPVEARGRVLPRDDHRQLRDGVVVVVPLHAREQVVVDVAARVRHRVGVFERDLLRVAEERALRIVVERLDLLRRDAAPDGRFSHAKRTDAPMRTSTVIEVSDGYASIPKVFWKLRRPNGVTRTAWLRFILSIQPRSKQRLVIAAPSAPAMCGRRSVQSRQ